MSKRLPELQRQRALLLEHLAWLDREIATEQASTPQRGATAGTAAPVLPAAPAPSPHPAAGAAPAPAPEIEQIFAAHEQAPGTLQHDARRGCWKAFWILMLGTLVIVGAAYALYARHIGRWW